MMLTLVLLLAATAALWVQLAPKPQPARVGRRRNLLQEDVLASQLSRWER